VYPKVSGLSHNEIYAYIWYYSLRSNTESKLSLNSVKYKGSETSSKAHPTSYPMGTSGSFPGSKGGRGAKLTIHLKLYLHSLNTSSWHGA